MYLYEEGMNGYSAAPAYHYLMEHWERTLHRPYAEQQFFRVGFGIAMQLGVTALAQEAGEIDWDSGLIALSNEKKHLN